MKKLAIKYILLIALFSTHQAFSISNTLLQKVAIIDLTTAELLIINNYTENLGLLDADTNLSTNDLALTNLARSFPTVFKLLSIDSPNVFARKAAQQPTLIN